MIPNDGFPMSSSWMFVEDGVLSLTLFHHFAPKLFPRHFGGIYEVWVQPDFKNHDFRFSPHTPPSHKIKPKHQNHQTWLYTNHTKINSFCSQPCPTSLWRHLWGLSPATFPKPWFLFFTQHTTKSQNQAKITKRGYAPTMSRSIPFASKVFSQHFEANCEVWVQPHYQNHDFHFLPQTLQSHKIKPKLQNHQIWLCTNHAKINSFFPETFSTSLWRHLLGLRPTTFPKPWFSFFTPHTTKSQNQT